MLEPQPTDYVRFPKGFGPRVLVFVDTEEDFDWSQPMRRENIHVDSVRELHAIHQIMRDRGVAPHYLVDYPIATSPEAVKILRGFMADQGAVIGSQLHSWVNPPYQEELNLGNTYPGNLSMSMERAKLHTLTRAVEDSFGIKPIVYRAGRYGVGRNTASVLDELGYRADVSVRALYDYAASGGPSFKHIDFRPYLFGPERKLLEVPLSNVFIGALAPFGRQLFAFDDPPKGARSLSNGLLARSRLLQRIALTPEGIPIKAALRAARRLQSQGSDLFCISFHSPSVVPGNTPYVRNAADLAQFNGWMATMLDFLVTEIGATPANIEDVLDAATLTPAA
jgi:hypothetical protein